MSWQTLSPPYATLTIAQAESLLTGSQNSTRALSHDGDSTFYTSGVDDAGFTTASYSFGVRVGGTTYSPLLTIPNIPDRWTDPISGVCCYGNGSVATATISPSGKFAIVVTRSGATLTTWHFDKVSLPSGARTSFVR